MKYLMMTLMCFMVLGFTACGDDEKDTAAVEDTADAGTQEQSGETGEAGDAGDSGDASTEEVSDASVEVVEVPDASTEADAAE